MSASLWLSTSRRARELRTVLDDRFVRDLHRRMFGDVWAWAGRYRLTERNIGVPPARIAVDVRSLVADAAVWLAADTTWITPELAALRLHHQLVRIHPFPNGNGRHARLYTDVVVRCLGLPALTWGSGRDLAITGPTRAAYVRALRRADRDPDDLGELAVFARS